VIIQNENKNKRKRQRRKRKKRNTRKRERKEGRGKKRKSRRKAVLKFNLSKFKMSEIQSSLHVCDNRKENMKSHEK
jgi:hypothetical protein